MSAAPERIYAIILPNEPPLVFREGSQPANAIPYVRSDLAPKPAVGEIGELVRHLEGLAAFYKERPSVNQELKCPGMAEISTRECAELYQNLTAASNMISRLSERRGEWQWMPYDEAKAFLTWLDAQPTKPSEKLQEAYDFYLKNYRGDRPL